MLGRPFTHSHSAADVANLWLQLGCSTGVAHALVKMCMKDSLVSQAIDTELHVNMTGDGNQKEELLKSIKIYSNIH